MNRKNTFGQKTQYVLFIALFSFIAGCHPVGPDYRPPENDMPESWNCQAEINTDRADCVSDEMANWWTGFNDPVLTGLITRAIENNKDLKVASLRLMQARASLGIEKSGLYPKLNLSATGQWTRQAADSNQSLTTSQQAAVSLSDSYDRDQELFSVGLDSSWELDVFGGVRRSIEAAEANIQSAQADIYDVLISLSAEVAINYIQVRQYQKQISVIEDSLQIQGETHDIVCWHNQSGLGDELSVRQSQYNLENAKAQIPSLISAKERACNRISVLLGERPGTVQSSLNEFVPVPELPVSIAIGVPADLMRRRPDIRSAEARLIYQTAKVGVATADLYPRFILNGSISTSVPVFDQLNGQVLDHNDWVIKAGPQFVWNVFNAGAVRNNIKVQSYLQDQALLNYEQVVLVAQSEVETALSSYANEQIRYGTLDRAVKASSQAAEIAEYEYRAGLADFGNVLESQRTMLSFENQLVQSKAAMAINLVTLYKALGGGWDVEHELLTSSD